MKLSQKILDNHLIVRVEENRIDFLSALSFKEKIFGISVEDLQRIVLDLSDVTFIDSSGLGAIIAVHNFFSDTHEFELACLTPNVARVITLTHMDNFLKIRGNPRVSRKGATKPVVGTS